MLIQQSKIRSLKGKLKAIKDGTKLIVGARLTNDLDERLQAIGFPARVNVGETLLPADLGPVSHFNAHGKYIVRRDLPKETAYRMMEWHWTEFRGRYDSEEVSRIVEVPYERYPRTLTPPPSVELSVATTADGQRVLTSPAIAYKGEDDERLLHVVNLMLELVGFCQIYNSELGEIVQSPLRRLNWQLLPTGKRSWDQLKPDLVELIKRAKAGNQPVIEHRLESINCYGPDFVALGLAGFAGYVVFGFSDRNRFVLESIYTGNATYVFDDRWENMSKLTKRQILDEQLHVERLIHREGWEKELRSVLRVDPAKPK